MRFTMKVSIILACSILLAACSLTGAQTPAPTVDVAPTLDAARTQAAQTVEAELASRPTATSLPATATLAPSATELPSSTPAPTNTVVVATNTPPPTNVPAGPTNTPTTTITSTPSGYGCSITASSPGWGASFLPGADFDGRWTIKNTGTNSWAASEMDYRYLSGQKMHVGNDTYDLPGNVAAGASIEVIVDMKAPTAVGNYSTTWSISIGSTSICALPMNINVK
jgi:hypothetical protein